MDEHHRSRGVFLIPIAVVAFLVAIAAGWFLFSAFASGDDSSSVPDLSGQATVDPDGLKLERWSLYQSNQTHLFAAETLDGLVQCSWEADVSAKIQFDLNVGEGREVFLVQNKGLQDPEEHRDRDETNEKGVAEFDLDTDLPEGQTFGEKDFELQYGSQTTGFTLVFNPESGEPGSVTTNHVNCEDELSRVVVESSATPTATAAGSSTVTPSGSAATATATSMPPTTVGVVFDPRVREAVIAACGFLPEAATPHFEAAPEDIPQIAVGASGTIFEARHPIPKGQFAWFLVENDSPYRKCAVNPVCGNPQAPPEKFPPAPPDLKPPPPGKEVSPTPTRTATPKPGSPTPPPATRTPTRTHTPVNTPTATPKPPQTPAPTFTPAPSGCPTQKPCDSEGGFDFPTVIPTPGQSNPEPEDTTEPPHEEPTGAAPYPTEIVRP